MSSPHDPTRRDFLRRAGAVAAACHLPLPTMADAHDDALRLLAAHGPEFGPGFANHGPMVIEALGAVQRADAIAAWLQGYRPNLLPAPARGTPLPDAVQQARLGRADAFADWEATFTAELQQRRWQDVVGSWQPRLLPGLAGALGHGVIRTGHAVRALAARDSEPRRQELARALAFQAACCRPLLGPVADGDGDPLAALAAVPAPPTAAPPAAPRTLDERLAALRDHAPLQAAVARAGNADSTAFLSRLLLAIAQQFVRHGAEAPIGFCHAFTATAALVPLWPLLDAPTRTLGVRHAWQFAAAIQCRFAKTPFTPPPIEAMAWPEDLVDAAVGHGDEHVIKFTAACALAWRAAAEPAFVAAARQIARLL